MQRYLIRITIDGKCWTGKNTKENENCSRYGKFEVAGKPMEIKVKHRTNNRNRSYLSSGYNTNRGDNRIKQEIIGGIKEAKQSILTRYNSEKKSWGAEIDLYSSENGYLTSGITDRKRKKRLKRFYIPINKSDMENFLFRVAEHFNNRNIYVVSVGLRKVERIKNWLDAGWEKGYESVLCSMW